MKSGDLEEQVSEVTSNSVSTETTTVFTGGIHLHGDIHNHGCTCTFYFMTPESPVANHSADAEKSGEPGKA